jgi:energy-coupling factor transporter ATP-binding protein EcfA2
MYWSSVRNRRVAQRSLLLSRKEIEPLGEFAGESADGVAADHASHQAFLHREPKTISLGAFHIQRRQRQAISLLMSTARETHVLLLDEHTAALDPRTGEFVMELTREIVRQLSLTTVMVTHSMAQALHFGDRTVMFHRGKIVFDVAGEQRAAMTVADLLYLFRRDQGENSLTTWLSVVPISQHHPD